MEDQGEEEPRPGNWDRAWNDPPLFSYTSTAAKGKDAPSAKLNKRVGMTFGSGQPPKDPNATKLDQAQHAPALHDAGAKATGGAMPPPPPPSASTIAPPPPTSDKEPASVPEQKEEEAPIDPDEVVNLLKEVVDSSTLDDRKKQDISKRISMMEKKWKDGQLNDKVHAGVHKIATALKEGDAATAEKAQLSLIVDWPSLCGTWLVGIKHLIANAKE